MEISDYVFKSLKGIFLVAFLIAGVVFVAIIIAVILQNHSVRTEIYVNRICQKIIRRLDKHLPCPSDIQDQTGRPTDRKALWSVIRGLCIPASYLGLSFPCVKVDRSEGYAIIRSPSRSRVDFIIAATSKIEGIESLIRSKVTSPNLWKAAWLSRDLLRETSDHDISWDEIVMAINSKATRSQDQLHLHLGCFDRKLRAFIAAEASRGGSQWRFVRTETIHAGLYLKFLTQDAIDYNLFAMINNEINRADIFAEAETIALAGVMLESKPSFALMVTLMPVPAERFLSYGC